MRRIYTAGVLFLASAFGYVGMIAAQPGSDSPRDERQPPRQGISRAPGDSNQNEERIEQLWQQIGRMHEQIVRLELGQDETGSTSPESRPGRLATDEARNQPGQADEARNQPGQADEARNQPGQADEARNQPGQRGLRSPDARPNLPPSVVLSDSDELWQRAAQLHRQLVSSVEDEPSATRPSATRQPETSARGARGTTREPGASARGTTGQPETNARGDQENNRLLAQYAAIQMEIIRKDVNKVKMGSPGGSESRDPATSAPRREARSDN